MPEGGKYMYREQETGQQRRNKTGEKRMKEHGEHMEKELSNHYRWKDTAEKRTRNRTAKQKDKQERGLPWRQIQRSRKRRIKGEGEGIYF